MTRVTLYLVAGDDAVRTFDYLDSSGASVSLVGYTAQFALVVGDIPFAVAGTVDGPNGKVTVQVPHTTTNQFTQDDLTGIFSVTVTSSGGAITTIAGGPVVVITP